MRYQSRRCRRRRSECRGCHPPRRDAYSPPPLPTVGRLPTGFVCPTPPLINSLLTPLPHQFEATPDTTATTSYASPTQDASTILDDTPQKNNQPEPREPAPKPEPELTPATAPSTQSITPASVSAVAATVKSTAADTYDELKQQLANAEATIASLKNEMAGGLRQRKGTAAGSAEPQAATAPAAGQELAQAVRQGTEGVPVQIVAVLCLASFLLAYFFF